jgi:hypothetical protein
MFALVQLLVRLCLDREPTQSLSHHRFELVPFCTELSCAMCALTPQLLDCARTETFDDGITREQEVWLLAMQQELQHARQLRDAHDAHMRWLSQQVQDTSQRLQCLKLEADAWPEISESMQRQMQSLTLDPDRGAEVRK